MVFGELLNQRLPLVLNGGKLVNCGLRALDTHLNTLSSSVCKQYNASMYCVIVNALEEYALRHFIDSVYEQSDPYIVNTAI